MTLSELKKAVDAAFERAAESSISTDSVPVSLQIDIPDERTIWASDGVELIYDNDIQASGCVLLAVKENTENAEHGWLVEGVDTIGSVVWLCIVGGQMIWSADSTLAVRFSRVEDGAAMAKFLCKNLPGNTIGGLNVTDHIWSDK